MTIFPDGRAIVKGTSDDGCGAEFVRAVCGELRESVSYHYQVLELFQGSHVRQNTPGALWLNAA